MCATRGVRHTLRAARRAAPSSCCWPWGSHSSWSSSPSCRRFRSAPSPRACADGGSVTVLTEVLRGRGHPSGSGLRSVLEGKTSHPHRHLASRAARAYPACCPEKERPWPYPPVSAHGPSPAAGAARQRPRPPVRCSGPARHRVTSPPRVSRPPPRKCDSQAVRVSAAGAACPAMLGSLLPLSRPRGASAAPGPA